MYGSPGPCHTADGDRLVGQISEDRPEIDDEVLDLHDDMLGAVVPGEMHVDRSGPNLAPVQGILRGGDPSARAREFDDQLLPTEMLDITGQVRSGTGLDEACELRVDGSRADREGLERDVPAGSTFDPAPSCLPDARPIRRRSLRQSERDAGLADANPDPPSDGGRAITTVSTRARDVATRSMGHCAILLRGPSPALT
jgi:hypothetical protein